MISETTTTTSASIEDRESIRFHHIKQKLHRVVTIVDNVNLNNNENIQNVDNGISLNRCTEDGSTSNTISYKKYTDTDSDCNGANNTTDNGTINYESSPPYRMQNRNTNDKQKEQQKQRRLKHHGHHHHHNNNHDHHNDNDNDNDDDNDDDNGKKKNSHTNNNINMQHGMMIDAGSQGTRVHVYEFHTRKLSTVVEIHQALSGKKLSFPTTDTRWTNRLKPGLDTFAYIENENERIEQIGQYLLPLIDFSKEVLINKEEHWMEYPIYLKATGGLRALPRPYRIRLIHTVRTILNNHTFNPFLFEDEHARVISGEEEAIYGWTAVNFVKGALIRDSQGSGAVTQPAFKTYGVLEMGGASSQIGFFEPNGDVMANLFKLQIGSAKHWNVYVHSFLYFGVNLAFDILNAELYKTATTSIGIYVGDVGGGDGVYNPCLPGKSQYQFTSRVHVLPDGTLLPLSDPNNASLIIANEYSTIMKNDYGSGDYELCSMYVQKQLRKEANSWCNFAHDNDCSFAGIYQPPLPISVGERQYFGEFIATSNFYDVFKFLGLTTENDIDSKGQASIRQLRVKSKHICSMNLHELNLYNEKLDDSISSVDELVTMCFRSIFIGTFLVDGFGFPESYNVTAIGVSNGQKLDWALGSMLYEINTLPWEFGKLDTTAAGTTTMLKDDDPLYDYFFTRSILGGGDDNDPTTTTTLTTTTSASAKTKSSSSIYNNDDDDVNVQLDHLSRQFVQYKQQYFVVRKGTFVFVGFVLVASLVIAIVTILLQTSIRRSHACRRRTNSSSSLSLESSLSSPITTKTKLSSNNKNGVVVVVAGVEHDELSLLLQSARRNPESNNNTFDD